MAGLTLGKMTKRKVTKEDIKRLRRQGVKESAVKKVERDVERRKKEERKRDDRKDDRRESVTPTTEKPTIDLSAQRKQRIKEAKSIKDVGDINVKGPEWGKTKREVFAEEHPTQKKILDVAGATGFYGAMGVGAGALLGGVGAATSPTIKVSTATMNTVRNKILAQQISTKLGTFGNVGKVATEIGKNYAITSRFATNTKTVSLTKKILIGAGLSAAAASIAKDLFGTYPFASFGKEETLQSVGFVMTQAINSGLYEEAQGVLDSSNEIINAAPTLADKIPYANVQKEFQRYITQQGENNKVWQEIIDKKIAENTGEIETDFARQRREGDEAARERDITAREEDTAFFDKQEEEKKEEDLAEMQWKSEYYALIREGKFEEAEELLQAQ